MAEESGIDLKSRVGYRHFRGWKGMAHELGSGYLCASDEFYPTAGVSPVCRALSRRLQGPEFLLPGSVSLPGLRATHRARKFARHRRNAAGSGRVANSYKPVERIVRITGHDPAHSGVTANSKPLKVWPTRRTHSIAGGASRVTLRHHGRQHSDRRICQWQARSCLRDLQRNCPAAGSPTVIIPSRPNFHR